VEMVTNALNWIEIPVTDFERAKSFYNRIFDYEMPQQPMGANLLGFLPFDFGKGVGGAIVLGEGYVPSSEGSLVYLNGGADLTTVLERVEPAGGRVVLGKTEIPRGLGFFAIFTDSEGNRLALHSIK
jgi:predicted enzyme related to lactoylglutathione lyase